MPTPRLTQPAMIKAAKAALLPVRQRTQYSCMASSMAMALNALGHKCDEDGVNRVMGAQPMRGASWEQALACSQHYGCRATLTTPSTLGQVKEWTDRGVPVMIAWNPEGREWSHASVVFDVTEDPEHGLLVHVADPNIPDPDETVRVVPKAEFYKKWYEKWPDYLVRRPACAIEREVTPEGRQVMASVTRVANVYDGNQDGGPMKTEADFLRVASAVSVAERYLSAKQPQVVQDKKKDDPMVLRGPRTKQRDILIEQMIKHPGGTGSHHTRERDVAKGQSRKPKHKKDWRDE